MGEDTILGDKGAFCAGPLWEREPVPNPEQLKAAKARDKDTEMSIQVQIWEEQDEITDRVIQVCMTSWLLQGMGCDESMHSLTHWVV